MDDLHRVRSCVLISTDRLGQNYQSDLLFLCSTWSVDIARSVLIDVYREWSSQECGQR
jgi:hypothetical protein